MKNLATSLFAVVWLFSLSSSGLANTKKLRIGWVYAMANAPILVAHEKNMFKDQGVDVVIRRFNSGPLLRRAMEAGDLDMAYIGMPPVYHSYLSGFKSKIVAKVNYGQAAIIVRHDSDIKELSQLRGKKIASVRKGSGMDVLLRGFILDEIANLKPEQDVTLLHMPAKMMDASVARGVVNAAFTWEPYISQAELSHQSRVLFDMNEAVSNYPWYVIVATEDTIDLNREAMTKVMNAHLKAVQYINSHHSETNKIIAREFNLYAVDERGKIIAPEEIVDHARTRLGWSCQFQKKDKKFLQRLINYSHKLGLIKTKINADEIIYEHVIGDVYQ